MQDDASAPATSWRKSYIQVFELPALGCAWEFVRRNAKISEAWSALKPAWHESVGDHGLKIVEATEPLSAPYLWTSSPDEDAASASVIWNPITTTRVLNVISLPPKLSFGGQVLDLEFIAAEKTLFVSLDGTQQLLLRDGIRSLQLNISGARITEPSILFVDTAISEEHPEIQLRLLECFRMLRAGGSLPSECFPPHPYAKRAAAVLMALDGHLAGASHREIAVAMFGEERVDRDWSDPREHLRDAVRHTIARGLVLMEGGYRMFLR